MALMACIQRYEGLQYKHSLARVSGKSRGRLMALVHSGLPVHQA